MKENRILTVLVLMALALLPAMAQRHLSVNTRPGFPIQPTMYGIFFEDINFGADGGLYAEMVENRSFEFPNRLMGWNAFGNVSIGEKTPAFERNPHYAIIEPSGHSEKVSGLENRGFFGMGLKQGMTYDFSVYARMHLLNGKQAKIRVELVDDQNDIITRQTITVGCNQWKKFSCTVSVSVFTYCHKKTDQERRLAQFC